MEVYCGMNEDNVAESQLFSGFGHSQKPSWESLQGNIIKSDKSSQGF